MALTDPYKIRLGAEIITILDTVGEPPEYVRRAIRWAHALDLTEASVTELISARALVRQAGDVYRDPTRAIEMMIGDAVIAPVDALAELEHAGWTQPYLCAACDALNGTWLAPFTGASSMRQELWDAEQIASDGPLGAAGGLVAKHGGDPARWQELLRQLNDRAALQLRDIAIEFWRGHRLVEARLGYGA